MKLSAGRRLRAVAIAAQIGHDDGEILRQARRHLAPHHMGLGIAVEQQQRRSAAPITRLIVAPLVSICRRSKPEKRSDIVASITLQIQGQAVEPSLLEPMITLLLERGWIGRRGHRRFAVVVVATWVRGMVLRSEFDGLVATFAAAWPPGGRIRRCLRRPSARRADISTGLQADSGLDLEAQRQAVARHVAGGQLLAEYVEIESGRKIAPRSSEGHSGTHR